MIKKMVLSTSLLGALLTLGACSSVVPPAPAAVCATCTPVQQVSYAVTRPLTCNDYPVTYRVVSPETTGKVLSVNSAILVPSAPTVTVMAQNQNCRN